MSEECKDCGHEVEKHNVLKEPYGRLCISCVDGGNMDPCRQYTGWLPKSNTGYFSKIAIFVSRNL